MVFKPKRCAALFAMMAIVCGGAAAQCGVERWSVKTGTDADAAKVDATTSTTTTIASLVALATPPVLPPNNRLQPAETTVFVLSATLIEFKLETDSDYHIVIQDTAGRTMITEIPSPACVGAGSPFASAIATARSKFDAQLKATSFAQTTSIPVQIKGVGFFDSLHGQTGVAPNGIELHPVLDIIFKSPAGTVNTTQQLIGNPGFENGSANPAPWTASPGVVNHAPGKPPHSGAWNAWLNGCGVTHIDMLSQTVTLPARLATASLSFWLHIDTSETSATTTYDTLKVQVTNSSGTVLATLATYSNLDRNTGYAQKTFDLAAYKGQTIKLLFTGVEDATLQTSFMLDDFTLTVQ